MKILMLGGTGYLGGRLIKRFAEKENEILCVTRVPEKYTDCFNIIYHGYDGLEDKIMDFRPDLFINLVCSYPKAGVQDEDILEANFIVPGKVLQLCIVAGVSRVVTMGTALPDEFNLYSFSKKLFADLGKWYAKRENIQFFHIILESFYGEEQPINNFISGLMDKMLRNEDILLTAGTQKRDFIYVDDAVDAIYKVSTGTWNDAYAEIPVGTGEAPTIRELAEYLHNIVDSQSKLIFGAIPMRPNEPDTVADRQQMEKWGITPIYGWKAGLRHMVDGLKKMEQTR